MTSLNVSILLPLLLLLQVLVGAGGSFAPAAAAFAGAAARSDRLGGSLATVPLAAAAMAAVLLVVGRCARMGHSQSWPRMPRAALSPCARIPSNCQPVGGVVCCKERER